jgi:hypothetical protein
MLYTVASGMCQRGFLADGRQFGDYPETGFEETSARTALPTATSPRSGLLDRLRGLTSMAGPIDVKLAL